MPSAFANSCINFFRKDAGYLAFRRGSVVHLPSVVKNASATAKQLPNALSRNQGSYQ